MICRRTLWHFCCEICIHKSFVWLYILVMVMSCNIYYNSSREFNIYFYYLYRYYIFIRFFKGFSSLLLI